MRANKESHFFNDKIKNLEKALSRKEEDIMDLEKQLIELRDSKFDKSQQLNQVNANLMSRITDLQAKLKKEQVEQFKLNEKLMERDNLILRLESHR